VLVNRQVLTLHLAYPAVIKVAAEVVVRTRRIVVRLSSGWPHLGRYRRVCERLRAPSRFLFPILLADPLDSPLL
jgi:hypothetical protein